MLNLAGTSFDFGNVVFAVLQECEHSRRGLLAGEAPGRLREIARRKLAEIRVSYDEAGGGAPYWQALEREVLETAMPQYIPRAVEQTRLEQTNYDLWRRGDPLCRTVFGLLGLVVGGLIIALPFVPIWEDTFAFLLAGVGLLYPEIRKTAFDYRHSRLLNQLISGAEKYQKNPRLHYLSQAQIEQELDEVGKIPAARAAAPESSPAAFPGRERGKQGQSGPG
jgi:hypothetical protein